MATYYVLAASKAVIDHSFCLRFIFMLLLLCFWHICQGRSRTTANYSPRQETKKKIATAKANQSNRQKFTACHLVYLAR